MADKITLRALFDSKQSELAQKLEGLSLPKDNQKIQDTISEYLSSLFDSEGEFRQNLTQAEDYLLQATMSLLTAQQEMGKAFIAQKIQFKTIQEDEKPENADKPIIKQSAKSVQDFLGVKVSATQAGIGTAAGALVGKLAFGGWGAVFGAIAGTAVVVYLASRNNAKDDTPKISGAPVAVKTEIVNEPIDVQTFIGVVGGICDSVDNLISTFRAQVNRVIDKYETMEKPTIEKDYRFLLESIQSLIGYKRTHSPEEEKYTKKIQSRIEDVAECLDNYNLEFVDYDGENEFLFDMVSSPETKEKKMVYPAIVKEGVTVIKGKVFVPGNNLSVND